MIASLITKPLITNGCLPHQDSFAKALIAEGLDADTIKAWTVDPQVLLVKGEDKKGSVFDQLEDKDSAECIAKLKELYGAKSA
jgi:hypothetical protein